VRHLSDDDKNQLKTGLAGFHLKIQLGVATGVPDGLQLANELQSALRAAGVTVADKIPFLINDGSVLYGVQLDYHGDEQPLHSLIRYYSNSPLGILETALIAAHLPVSSIHPQPSYVEDTIEVVIGFDPDIQH
jgi:hypothetical protein